MRYFKANKSFFIQQPFTRLSANNAAPTFERSDVRTDAPSEAEFNGIGGLQVHMSITRIGTLHAAMQSTTTRQGNRTMTKKLALAASMVMLTTISGQAFAETSVPSDQQAIYASNAFDRVAATDTDATNAYRYHGGPKYND